MLIISLDIARINKEDLSLFVGGARYLHRRRKKTARYYENLYTSLDRFQS